LSAALPDAKPLVIAGPAGDLEALLEIPQGASAREYAVVCHPHPLHGGSLQNKVVHTLARAFHEVGVPTLRFNFRGVGASAGSFDHGRGETEDALAVIEWGAQRWPGAALSLAGFSFGALVALRAAQRVPPIRLICVAPPVARPEATAVASPSCPWLIIQGDADEIVDHRQVAAFAARTSPAPTLRVLAGVDHFFHGRLRELQATVVDFMRPPAT
jgi:alpha/beta superfamily hydrolase